MNTQRGLIFKVLLLIIAFAAGIYVAFRYLGAKPESSVKTYSDSAMSFEYPADLTVSKDNDLVRIDHSVPSTHPNPCDFKGDSKPLDAVNDFAATIKLANQSVMDYVKTTGWPDWQYVSANPYRYGAFSGYRVMSGVEGCGSDIYYLFVSQNKTVIITRRLVTELTDVTSDQNTYAKLPGIISLNKAETYFSQILSSLTVK